MNKEQAAAAGLIVYSPAENEPTAGGYVIELFARIVVNRQDVDSYLDIDARKLSLPRHCPAARLAKLAFLAGYNAGQDDADKGSP